MKATVKTKPRASTARPGGARLTVEEEYALNNQAARRLMREAKRKPEKWVKGHWIGLSEGKVITVSPDVEEVLTALRRVSPDRRRGMIMEVGVDYDRIEWVL